MLETQKGVKEYIQLNKLTPPSARCYFCSSVETGANNIWNVNLFRIARELGLKDHFFSRSRRGESTEERAILMGVYFKQLQLPKIDENARAIFLHRDSKASAKDVYNSLKSSATYSRYYELSSSLVLGEEESISIEKIASELEDRKALLLESLPGERLTLECDFLDQDIEGFYKDLCRFMFQ